MITEEIILSDVCLKYNCSIEQLRGSRRGDNLPKARKEVSIKLRSLGYSLPHIGRVLNKEHTTILSHVRPS